MFASSSSKSKYRLAAGKFKFLRHFLSFKFFIGLLLTFSFFIGWKKIWNPHTFPINHIEIIGNLDYVPPVSLKRIISPYLNEGFLNLDSAMLENDLEKLTWVSNVTVKKNWPSTLIIHFTVKKPVAHFGKSALLDEEGNIFAGGEIALDPNLPWLNSAPEQTQILVKNYFKLGQALSAISLKISQLSLTEEGTWQIRLDNGLELFLSQTDFSSRLQHFIEIYPQVFAAKATNIDYIDLRYAHGMAVRFKKNATHSF